MKFVAYAAAVAAVAIASPAVAQDAEPAFSGPRIEARVGWDRPDVRVTLSDGVDQISRSAGKSGVTYGGEVGYDIRAGQMLVLGGYAGLEGSTTKACDELYGEDRICIRAGRNITAGARIGAVLSPMLMVYGKGGYSNGRVSIDYQDYELILADVDEASNLDGFHLGAGIEASINRRIYGRLEYIYSNYGKLSASVDDITGSVKPTRHQVAYAMGVRF
jgi:outer membrane immunogenic protein